MPKFVMEESTYAGPIEADTVLNAEVTAIKVKEKDWKDDDGNAIRKVEFTFVVTEPDSAHDGQKLWGETPTTFSTNEKCKLRNWAIELMGADTLDAGFELDTDDLIGLPCRIIVGARNKKDKEGKETGDIANFVQDVLRSKGTIPAMRPGEEPF